MTTYKGIVFDKDGTLFDYAATWEVWAQSMLMRLCAGDGAKATEVGAAIGYDMATQKFTPDSIAIAGTPDDLAAALTPHFPALSRAGLIDVLNEEAETAPQSEAVPLVPFLTGLRGRGLCLGVATNDAEGPARAHLAQAGVTGLFDFIAGYDSGFGGKPAPGQLFGFCDAVHLSPSRVIMVGDSTHDLIAGKAAGMTCIGVLTGYAETAELAPFAEAVLPDIGHLTAWLDRATATPAR